MQGLDRKERGEYFSKKYRMHFLAAAHTTFLEIVTQHMLTQDMQTHVHTHKYTHVHTHTHAQTHTCIHTFIYDCTSSLLLAHPLSLFVSLSHTNIDVHTQPHTYTHMHAHTQKH